MRLTEKLTVQQVPVKYAIVYVIVVLHDFSKQLSQEVVVGCFFKPKLSNVVQINFEFL